MSAQPAPLAGNGATPATDTDQQETREWMDALSAVIDKEGADRPHLRGVPPLVSAVWRADAHHRVHYAQR